MAQFMFFIKSNNLFDNSADIIERLDDDETLDLHHEQN